MIWMCMCQCMKAADIIVSIVDTELTVQTEYFINVIVTAVLIKLCKEFNHSYRPVVIIYMLFITIWNLIVWHLE